jgi:hypothetical protein
MLQLTSIAVSGSHTRALPTWILDICILLPSTEESSKDMPLTIPFNFRLSMKFVPGMCGPGEELLDVRSPNF